MRYPIGLLCFIALMCPSFSVAATTKTASVQAAAEGGKYTYVMFYKTNDSATKRMATEVSSHVAETGAKTTWVSVNVKDRKEAEIIKRFDASRMPLPAVFGVAPNGAITGVFRQKVNQEQLANAILTPRYAEMVESLQNQKIAVVCMMPAKEAKIPAGVTALANNPEFKGKLHHVRAYATDDQEREFFRRMKVDANITLPVVLMFAPPGNHLGTYNASVDGSDLAKRLHSSGKCNCSKCQKK